MDGINVLSYADHVEGLVGAQIALEINLFLMHTLNVVLHRAGVNGHVVALAASGFFCQAMHRFGMGLQARRPHLLVANITIYQISL